MNHRNVTVVGGGQMGQALVGGMLNKGVLEPQQIRVVEPQETTAGWWADQHRKVIVSKDLASSVANAEVVVLAVKPNVVASVLIQGSELWQGKLVVSIAAGITLEQLSDWTGHRRVVRVMPNTPCLVGQGACAYCGCDEVTSDDEYWIESALGSIGLVVKVEPKQMDAVTGLSGSGPAYICLVVEALADGGVLAGLPRPLAMQLATQTVLGTAQMIAETRQHPGVLKDAVASPAGTTIAALKVLEEQGLRAALINAVAASASRSADLGKHESKT